MTRLGQHFLKNSSALKKAAGALGLSQGETVIEIGPGHGELTEHLLETGAFVKAIEKDRELVPILKNTFHQGTFSLTEGDVRDTLPVVCATLGAKPYKIAGNIPYYLTGQILRDISELPNLPSHTVFTIQKEVAERIVANPPKMNRLAASVQFWAHPKILQIIHRNDFSPPPKVDSATILLVKKDTLPCERVLFEKALAALFSAPRKTVLNNMRSYGIEKEAAESALHGADIAPSARPQDLRIENICAIAKDIF